LAKQYFVYTKIKGAIRPIGLEAEKGR